MMLSKKSLSFPLGQAGLACVMLAAAGCSSEDKPPAPPGPGSADADWRMIGYDAQSTFWNRGETRITPETARGLAYAWEFDTTTTNVTGTPVVSGGRVYVMSGFDVGVVALNLADGGELWRNVDVVGSSSLALDDGVLYAHDGGGIIHALSIDGGGEIWQSPTDDQLNLVGFSSPVVSKDFVIVGGSTLEELAIPETGPQFRGFISAVKKDGTPGWKIYTVEPPSHGATLWSSVSVDEESGIVLGATGNNHGPPPGDTSDAFLAVPLRDEPRILWKQQIFEGDIWNLQTAGPDNDFGANPILFDLDGRKLAAGGNKGGDFWVVDRVTGEVLQQRNIGGPAGRGASTGGVFVNGAWDGKSLLVAVNGATSTGPGSEEIPAGKRASTLFSLDPHDLYINWERQVVGPVFSWISVANGVGFFGKDMTLQAFDTSTGEVLFEFPTEGTIATAPAISNGYVVFGSGMSWSFVRVAAVMVAATWIFGCSGGEGGQPPPEPPGPPSFTRVTKEVITGLSCGGQLCHSLAAGGFTLTSKAALYDDLVDQVAGGEHCGPNAGADGGAGDGGARPTYIRVIPNDPENSLLYQKLSYSPPCGDPMPPVTGQLSSAQVQLVYDWIALGAKND
jgi:outer membrane protein assembly factor BamB